MPSACASTGTRASRCTRSTSDLPPRGDDEVDQPGPAEHGGDMRAVGIGRHLHAGGGQAGLGQPGDHGGVDGARAVQALGAAAQNDGVAGFQADRGGIGTDIGAAFVDYADHADRRRNPAEFQPVRPCPFGKRAGQRVGQRRDLLQPGSHCLDPVGGERQPVTKGGGGLARGQVGLVGGEDGGGRGAELGGAGEQGGVALGARHACQRGGGGAGVGSGLVQPTGCGLGLSVHRRSCSAVSPTLEKSRERGNAPQRRRAGGEMIGVPIVLPFTTVDSAFSKQINKVVIETDGVSWPKVILPTTS